MKPSQPLELRPLLIKAARNTFATMLRLSAEEPADSVPLSSGIERVVASVGFGGPSAAGILSISVSPPLANTIASAMLQQPAGHVCNSSDVNDVMGELANVIAGNCLASLAAAGFNCALGLPAVIRGADIRTDPIRGATHESITLSHGPERSVMTLDLKTT